MTLAARRSGQRPRRLAARSGDLVTFIERSLGPGYLGTYNGIFATCRVVPPEEEL